MKNQDRKVFAKAVMAKLLFAMPAPDVKNEADVHVKSDVYFEALESYDLPEVEVAAMALIREPGRVFFPTPGELIAAIHVERRRRAVWKELPPTVELDSAEREEVQRQLKDLYAKLGTAMVRTRGSNRAVGGAR